MIKKFLSTVAVGSLLATSGFANEANNLKWSATAFGQSVDLNFGSTILPEKVGTNNVTSEGKILKGEDKLSPSVTIESRGGKLANSHDGMTYYYTYIPSNSDFTISAIVELEQIGPETGATPNFQEGAGIMLRDIVGNARLNPQPTGHEEFPAASNMVSNVIVANARANNGKININANFRQGVYEPWGTKGNKLIKTPYVEGIAYKNNNKYKMTLSRSEGKLTASVDIKGKVHTQELKAPANIAEMQDSRKQYLGFFASRNAKIKVSDITLEVNKTKRDNSPKFVAKQEDVVVQDLSSNVTAVDDYNLQARSNYRGVFTVLDSQDKVLVKSKTIKAGSLFSYKHNLAGKESESLKVSFKPMGSKGLKDQVYTKNITKDVKIADPLNIYVSANGRNNNDGSKANPTSLERAISLVQEGGTIHLEDGRYKAIEIPLSASGSDKAYKTIKPVGNNVVFTGDINHNANYFNVSNIEVAGAMLIVSGSHNNFDGITTHSAKDTGFQITSPSNVGRALWASHNIVKNSESYNNMDPSKINADGFAAKMRVGDGNTFINCIAYNNIDDGWDLFNKVEDGANGVVTIINSIAFRNGATFKEVARGGTRGNGFKLGGEGLPVNHVIKDSLAFANNMDGFTDNFNPGTLVVENNISLDNKRFNYIFRKSPHGSIKQGRFKNNKSLRLTVESKYEDVVNSSLSSNNSFLDSGKAVSQLDSKVASILNKKQITKQDALDLRELLKK